jgi:L-alanine-DL-glutamate epimerase-like enolase superfamily enzyme
MMITHTHIYRFSIPMEPFAIATGTMDYAQNVLIHVFTNDGLKGVGECSAFPVITGETQDTCLALAKDFARIWKGKDASQIKDRMQDLNSYIVHNHTVKSAFDMALYDLAAKAANQPLYQYLGGTYAEPESDLTIGIDSPQNMAATAYDFVTNRGVHIIKIKLGKKVADDVERVKLIRAAVGAHTKLRIDANQGWSYEDAVWALDAMNQYGIQFCEQPLPKHLDHKMPALRHITPIPLMADESVFSSRDAARIINEKSFDYINIKVCKAGGIRNALKIHDKCSKKGIANMLGGMLESRVALSANVHLALACPNIQFYDLDTCLLGHKADPVTDGVQFIGMKLKLPGLPGIGADADHEFLESCDKIIV